MPTPLQEFDQSLNEKVNPRLTRFSDIALDVAGTRNPRKVERDLF